MATLLKAKYKLIDKKRISQQAKDILDELSEATNDFKDVSPALRKEFNTFYTKLKSAKPEAIRGTKEYKAFGTEGAPKPSATPEPSKKFRDAIKKSREARRLQGLSTSADDIKKDAGRPALKAGRRKAKESGKTYYEYRENRIDRRPARYPKLEQGGKIENQYFGLAEEDLWNRWKGTQRMHFLEDHRDKYSDNLDLPNYTNRDLVNMSYDELPSIVKGMIYEHRIEGQYAEGGGVGNSIGSGKNGYIARYKGKTVDVYADTMYEAQKKAAQHFKAKKEWEVNVMLAEVDGKQYVHSTAFAQGGGVESQPNLFDMHTTEEHRSESEPQMVRTQFEEEEFEYGDGGGVKSNYKIKLRFKGLSGSQSEIGNYVVSKRTLDKLENMYSFGVSIDVIDETNEKANNYNTVANDISKKYDSLLGKFALGGRPKSAIMRDRAYQSDEPWEKNYERSGKPKHPKYSREEYAEGGNVVMGKKYVAEWRTTSGDSGYDILEVIDTKYHSNRYGGGFVVRFKIVESSDTRRIGTYDEETKDGIKRLLKNNLLRPIK